MIGLGDASAKVKVYIDKRPPMDEFTFTESITPICIDDIERINSHCGNGWRKVFNLMAKVVHPIIPNMEASWQAYRDKCLLKECSHTALLFSPPPETSLGNHVHIVMGKGYADSLNMSGRVEVNIDFSIHHVRRIICTPYFDYRQLTNEKVHFLQHLIKSHFPQVMD